MLFSSLASGHEKGAPFAGSIIDPLETHHAHIEDEQRVNFFFRKSVPGADEAPARDRLVTQLELAVASPDFNWGAEAFVPLSNEGETADGRKRFGLGDVELQALKYSFLRRREQIATAALGLTLPSGDEARGLGEGQTIIAPHFFFDQALSNWYLGVNLAPGAAVTGPAQTNLEWAAVVSYSLIRGTKGSALPRPPQRFVPSVSIEWLGESGLGGREKGETEMSVLPGVHLWSVNTGWQLHAGVRIPTMGGHEKWAGLFQIGSHFDWTGAH